MQPIKESPQDATKRIAKLTAIAEKHGVALDILVPDREILLITISRNDTKATLEAKHLGASFNVTLHESNPRGASGSDFEGVIKAFCLMAEDAHRDNVDESLGADHAPKPRG